MAVKLFECYGRFCARYAVEVIVCFLTMIVGAITLNVSSPHELCHWATRCSDSQNEVSSDVVLLTVLRCGTIIYVYIKLKKIFQTGSVYIIGIVCAYTVFAVLTFTITLMHFLRKDLVVVSSALPVFLLLIDVSHMTILTQHCLSAKSMDLLQDYIAEGMGVLTPVLTLDTLVELLVLVNIGGYINIWQLQQLSCFACLSVIIHYIVFTTLVPACLSVLLTAINKHTSDESNSVAPSWQDHRFGKVLNEEKGLNTQILSSRVKVMLCFPLIALHWFCNSVFRNQTVNMQRRFDYALTLNPEQFFTVILILILVSKYLFDDGHEIIAKLKRPTSTATNNEIKLHAIIQHESVVALSKHTKRSGGSDTLTTVRSVERCLELLNTGSDLLTDAEIIALVENKVLASYKLENALQDANRGVAIRRKLIGKKLTDPLRRDALHHVPHDGYDFTNATKACCENTVGYIPVPLGVVGPLLMDGNEFMVPMATTEGTLLASTNRGLKALHLSGGVKSCVYADGMTRAPVVQFPSVEQACKAATWLEEAHTFNLVKEKFDETSRFAKLKRIMPVISGRLLYIRFVASTGDAMGMNMLSKGTENAMRVLQHKFPDMKIISISGNLCTDKKPSAVNWILGRGKSVVCEAVLPEHIVKSVLKTDISTLVQLNQCKNHIGSAMCGSIGGFNAHAANIVTAIFIATGQDPAQNVVSSNCITTLETICSPGDIAEHAEFKKQLLITCTMPSLEVATVGGGSNLEPQKACLKLLGVAGSSVAQGKSGQNATQLAKLVCATVVAGELSLLSALDAGHLVQSHMRHNRLPRNETAQEMYPHIL